MFEDMVARLNPIDLKGASIRLNVATLCSGTEAPIFALDLIRDALVTQGFGVEFELNHLFSCEIEPFKQGFIRRNLPPGTLIFRDVVELASTALTGKATTASGSKAGIPAQEVDILFAGCSCVDYSNMNQNKPSGRVPALDRHLKQQPNNGDMGMARKPAPKKRTVDNDAKRYINRKQDLPTVHLDEAFVHDLDEALRELALLPSGGESARTFFAAIKLITVIRPKLVILENVYNAPWDMYTEQIFPKVCYVADFVRLDSKEFYLPQTRQRGYLLAVDAASIGAKSARAIIEAWKEQVPCCKRPASAPVSAFLRPVDDPATVQARADMENRSSSNAEWALCSLRHADVRQKHGIRRDDNPFSLKAMRNSRVIFAAYPSHSWMQFWDSQVARVVDFMDIAFATLRKESVDLGYKTCMIDVSQNVDRNDLVNGGRARVKSNLGIVGCITPSGLPIVTDLMRPITGLETLALQGLPVNDLIVSTESQAQLRDLAGNAMTVTVVGAVTLALLLAVSKTNAVTGLLGWPEPTEAPKRGLYLQAPRMESLERGRNRPITFDAQVLLNIAKDMTRLCPCSTQPDEVFRCDDCGTTACSICCINPVHSFVAKQATGSQFSAEQGRVRLMNILPNALMLPVPESIINDALGSIEDDLYRSAVCSIVRDTPVFFFDEVKVTETITVCYKKSDSIARLALSTESACCWYIYIAPWHRRRVELSKCFDLDQPIARGEVLSGDISNPHWSLWIPGRIDLELGFSNPGKGKFRPAKLSFAPGYGKVPNAALQHWRRSVEAKVCGTYSHHPKCGTAGNRLHIRHVSTTASDRVFMMWDSASLRDPDDDHFIWTETIRRLKPYEYREVLLHARPTHSWELEDLVQKPMSVFWPGYWSWPPEAEGFKPIEIYNPARIHWGSTESIRQKPCHLYGQTPIIQMPALATVSATFRGFPFSTSRFGAPRADNSYYIVPYTECDTFLRTFSFISNEICRSRIPESAASFPHLDGIWVPVEPCQNCSVTPPEVTVYTRKDPRKVGDKTQTETKGGGTKIPNMNSAGDDGLRTTKVVIEDPEEAALFERQYQDLPRAVAVAAHLRTDSYGFLTLDIRLLLQPRTLASRALAHLLQAHHTAARGRLAVDSDATTSFTVTLDYAPGSAIVGLRPFSCSVQPCSEDNTVGIDLACAREYELPDVNPPRFCRASTRARKTTSVQYRLRPSQREAVNWMLQRERVGLDFVKCEIEEEVVAPLNLRVMGKAEWTNHFPYCSRGGVVAHEIGYGKTVVTLAVCDYMRDFDTTGSIAERIQKVDSAWSEELRGPFEQVYGGLSFPKPKAATFFCHLSATLVIVPKHITAQWESEAAKFLGLAKPKLLVIKTVAAFYGDCSLEELQEAEIIIVSSAVFGKAFLDRLQPVSGPDESFPAGLFGRTLEAWYREALRIHRILTASYLAGCDASVSREQLVEAIEGKLIPALRSKRKAATDALVEKQVPEIDRQYYKRRIRGADKAHSAVISGNNLGGADPEVGRGSIGPEGACGETGSDDKLGDVDSEDKSSNTHSKKTTRRAARGKIASKLKKGLWAISCLHNCSFARIVWDECSYDDDSNIRLFVANAVANAKWLLSATPKLFALEQVCNISAAFGVHVARPEPRMMPGLPAVTKGPELAPMSKSEQFHVFASPVKSVTLAQERHNHAEAFVAAYFRANALDAEVAIEFEEHVVPIDMTESDSVRYHLLSQEILDSGCDYTALPEHARHEVTIRGVDLLGRDNSAAARMLLSLLACGLAKPVNSTSDLIQSLYRRNAKLSSQMKFLWDKMMWLRRWIMPVLDLKATQQEHLVSQYSMSIRDTLARVDALCHKFSNALLRDGNFEQFGGAGVFLLEASVVAHHQVQPQIPHRLDPDVMQLMRSQFRPGWEKDYAVTKALYTWVDFFSFSETTLYKLTEDQVRLLAEDLCWLRYKIDACSAPFRDGFPALPLTETDIFSEAPRSIPPNIGELFERNKQIIDGLDENEMRDIVEGWARAKKGNTTKQEARADLEVKYRDPKASKASLVELLTELNVKFSPNATLGDLREKLRQHKAGLATCDNYRDGRAPPDRHRDFEAATLCTSRDADKQAEAVNEELKRTMVHLAKTIEDLRATVLETNFIPRYSLVANASDKDSAVRGHSCCGCQNPLVSASASFLVVACGHFLCGECRSAAGFYCPVKDCPAFIRKRPVLQCSQIPTPYRDGPRKKAEHVARLVDQFPKDEYVVVFAQYRQLVSSLAAAFRRADLGVLDISAVKDDDVSRKLEDFKAGKAGRILLLDMDSETSAGSNLTIASRVIFVNPYVHGDEEHQIRTVRQAKGRCIRTGQTKKVHVYHFMVPGTVEEETLRTFAKNSPSVQLFFDSFERKPWWLL
ncbi:hypothetical protein C7999DRAFT_17603 [Corynascus novoguineensis]|uniref:SNF2 N-terminal domain-containing protein n=1 Tax=Corynascus novoguineensis TaxID=1126955 RepID=A0AAN7CL41_9PEZI|nr:hypothetical protein C7999DRAFT_17603 [Corynascus novoguineensis]